MIICEDVAALDKFRSSTGRVAFVPTMGALHDGHLSLVEIAKGAAEQVIVSIYVNPTQFAPGEDFEAYPRDLDADLAMLKAAGVDCVFLPDEADIYPDGLQVTVKAGSAAQGLESDFRPHFFDGVCSVVHRLFALARPNVAVFGEKDYQQLMVIREMVETQDLGVEILGGPIIRDEHGLALSSRNAYLNAEELSIARRLNQILQHKHPDKSQDPGLSSTRSRIKSGMLLKGENVLFTAGFTKVDYIEERWGRLLAAAWIGETRLIDNITTETEE